MHHTFKSNILDRIFEYQPKTTDTNLPSQRLLFIITSLLINKTLTVHSFIILTSHFNERHQEGRHSDVHEMFAGKCQGQNNTPT